MYNVNPPNVFMSIYKTGNTSEAFVTFKKKTSCWPQVTKD